MRAPAPAGPAEGAAVQPGGQRFPALGIPAGLGTPPSPSPQVTKLFDQFVATTIDPQMTLDLIQDRPRLLVLREAPLRVQVGDEKIVSYTLVTERELSLNGQTIGTTVVNLWFADPTAQGKTQILSYLVRVLPDLEQKERLERLYRALEGEIAKAFPDSAVRLTLVGDKVAVSGEVKDVIEAAQILRIVAAHAPGAGQGRGGTDQIPVDQINITAAPQQALPNNPFNPTQQPTLENFLLRDINRQVINLLRIPGEQQVQLRVTVAEVNRLAARSIGMDFSISNSKGQVVFAQATNALAASAATGLATGAANLPALIDNGQIALAIRALRSVNMARSLAEPNLVTLNGQPARFRAGGEFPVPSSSVAFGGVGQGVAFVPFGVSLQFLPYVTDRDRIRLQVSAEVSTVDPALGASVGGSAAGTSVPGLDDRTFESTIEMRQGQTLAVAGLVQNNFSATTNRVPLFGDIPVVGNLFGRNNTTSQEQEVVILITPELVHPLDRCDTPGLPGWDVFEPGDCEFYVLGRLESRRSEDYRTAVRTDWERMKRYEHCEDIFIIGDKGHSYGCCGGGACGCGQ